MAPSSPLRTGYLVLYNTVSAAAWAVVLYRTVLTCLNAGYPYTYFEVGEWTRWTQTAACLEVLHSLFGMSLLSPSRSTCRATGARDASDCLPPMRTAPDRQYHQLPPPPPLPPPRTHNFPTKNPPPPQGDTFTSANWHYLSPYVRRSRTNNNNNLIYLF